MKGCAGNWIACGDSSLNSFLLNCYGASCFWQINLTLCSKLYQVLFKSHSLISKDCYCCEEMLRLQPAILLLPLSLQFQEPPQLRQMLCLLFRWCENSCKVGVCLQMSMVNWLNSEPSLEIETGVDCLLRNEKEIISKSAPLQSH